MLSKNLQFPETEEILLVARYHAIRGPDVAAVPRRRYVDLVQADMRRHLCNEQDRFTNIFFLHHPRLLFGTRRFWAKFQNFGRHLARTKGARTNAEMAILMIDAFVHRVERGLRRRIGDAGDAADTLARH